MTRSTDQSDDFAEWTAEDDDLVRSALMTLGEDIDMTQLPDPEVVRTGAGEESPRSRAWVWLAAVAAAAVIVAAIAFSQLGRPTSEPVVPATQTETGTSPEPTSTEPTSSEPTDPSPEPTSEAPTTAPSDSASDPATSPSPGETIEPCGAVTGTVNAENVPEEVAAKARNLMELALGCERSALIDLAMTDQTELSFGGVTAEEAFAIPARIKEENRYQLLSTLLTFAPKVDEEYGFYRWPDEPKTDADWQALLDAGIIGEGDREVMEEAGGYFGYRVVIATNGQWTAFLGGD